MHLLEDTVHESCCMKCICTIMYMHVYIYIYIYVFMYMSMLCHNTWRSVVMFMCRRFAYTNWLFFVIELNTKWTYVLTSLEVFGTCTV